MTPEAHRERPGLCFVALLCSSHYEHNLSLQKLSEKIKAAAEHQQTAERTHKIWKMSFYADGRLQKETIIKLFFKGLL